MNNKNFSKTIGHSGTMIFSGQLTAEEYNRRLQGKQGLRMYDMMRKSEESVQAALKIVKLPLLGAKRDIVPASDDEKDIFIANYVKQQLFKNKNLNFHKFSREALTFLDFGHSVAEKTYELTNFEGQTLLGIKEIGFRKQTSIEAWRMQDGKPGIKQRIQTDEKEDSLVEIPRAKLMVWTNDQEGDNYEGISILRYAFKSWDMANSLGLVHAMGLEKMAIPTPVLSIPANASPADEKNAIESIQQYRSNQSAYLKIPVGWELDKFDLSGQSIDQLLPALQHYETKIMLSVLGQFLMLGTSSGSGSRAVSEDHSELFMLSEEATNKTFQDTVQQDLINQLVDINFSDLPNGYPTLSSTPIKSEDIEKLAGAIQKLQSSSLLTPTYETENHLRDTMKLPQLPEDYRDDYEQKRKMSIEVAEKTGKGKPINTTDSQKDDEMKKSTKASIIREAKEHQKKLIDVILG